MIGLVHHVLQGSDIVSHAAKVIHADWLSLKPFGTLTFCSWVGWRLAFVIYFPRL